MRIDRAPCPRRLKSCIADLHVSRTLTTIHWLLGLGKMTEKQWLPRLGVWINIHWNYPKEVSMVIVKWIIRLCCLCCSQWRQKSNILMGRWKVSPWTTQWMNSKLNGSELEVLWIAWSSLLRESKQYCQDYGGMLVKLCRLACLPRYPPT